MTASSWNASHVATGTLSRPSSSATTAGSTGSLSAISASASSRWDGSADAGPWLSRVTVNLSIDRWRRNKRRGQTFSPLVEGDHLDVLADHRPAPDRGVEGRESGERLAVALRALPERQRAVVVLRHYQELSLEEIATTLGMSLGTVKSSLHRALHRMRDTLTEAKP